MKKYYTIPTQWIVDLHLDAHILETSPDDPIIDVDPDGPVVGGDDNPIEELVREERADLWSRVW